MRASVSSRRLLPRRRCRKLRTRPWPAGSPRRRGWRAGRGRAVRRRAGPVRRGRTRRDRGRRARARRGCRRGPPGPCGGGVRRGSQRVPGRRGLRRAGAAGRRCAVAPLPSSLPPRPLPTGSGTSRHHRISSLGTARETRTSRAEGAALRARAVSASPRRSSLSGKAVVSGTRRLVPPPGGAGGPGGVHRLYRPAAPPRRSQPCRSSRAARTAGSTRAGSGTSPGGRGAVGHAPADSLGCGRMADVITSLAELAELADSSIGRCIRVSLPPLRGS